MARQSSESWDALPLALSGGETRDAIGCLGEPAAVSHRAILVTLVGLLLNAYLDTSECLLLVDERARDCHRARRVRVGATAQQTLLNVLQDVSEQLDAEGGPNLGLLPDVT